MCERVMCSCVLVLLAMFSLAVAQNGLRATKALGDTCTVLADCDEVANATCTQGYCACPSDSHVANSDNTNCYPLSSGYDDDCEIGPQCSVLGDGGTCSNKKCKCQDDFRFEDNKCLLVVGVLGGYCNKTTMTCYLKDDGDNQNADCINRNCKCKAGYRESDNLLQCKIIVEAGSDCTADSACTQNSTCTNRTCTCDTDFLTIDGACKRAIGDVCTTMSDCNHTTDTNCTEGICSCLQTHVPNSVNTQCYPLSDYYGSPCVIDPQCSTWGDGAMCAGKCMCQDNFLFSGAKCWFVINKVQDECEENSQICYLEADGDNQNVECRSRCSCKYGYVSSDDKLRCLAEFGTICKSSDTCIKNAVCVASQCVCNDKSIYQYDKCKEVVGPRGNCTGDVVCTENSRCVNLQCKCYDGYVEEEDLCRKGSGAAQLTVSLFCLLLASVFSLDQHRWR